MYVLEPDQRTVSNFANIIGELKERLHRWTRAGQYGFLFDNAEDTLSFSRFQTFNFAGWGDAPEVLEASRERTVLLLRILAQNPNFEASCSNLFIAGHMTRMYEQARWRFGIKQESLAQATD